MHSQDRVIKSFFSYKGLIERILYSPCLWEAVIDPQTCLFYLFYYFLTKNR